jgi:hypothetical protein
MFYQHSAPLERGALQNFARKKPIKRADGGWPKLLVAEAGRFIGQ